MDILGVAFGFVFCDNLSHLFGRPYRNIDTDKTLKILDTLEYYIQKKNVCLYILLWLTFYFNKKNIEVLGKGK